MAGVYYNGAAHFRELDKECSLGVRDFFGGEEISNARQQGSEEAQGHPYPFIYSAHCVNVHAIIGAIDWMAGCKINIKRGSTAKQKCFTFAAPKGDHI
jgi:hypothetical protein